MSDAIVLHKDYFLPLLRKLGKSYRLVGPVANDLGDVLYTDITDLDQASINLEHQPQNSLKSFFFPQTEPLASYVVDRDTDGAGQALSFYPLLPENRPTLYFGVRSCDLFAVLYMDMIFLGGKYRDIYYEQRRQNALFITIGCNTPFADCFCNATGNGPFLEFGFDLQMTDLGRDDNAFFVETGKAGGRKILKELPHFFSTATEDQVKRQYQAVLEARGLFQQLVHVNLACARLENGPEPEKIIADLSRRCQDCGGCAYICPTCTCFTITDQARDGDTGERIRTWDACTFAGFTKMAGDHNPVDVRQQRIRRRFYHKLKSDVQKHGRTSCVGCGRCVDICFGGVDIIAFIHALVMDEEDDHGI